MQLMGEVSFSARYVPSSGNRSRMIRAKVFALEVSDVRYQYLPCKGGVVVVFHIAGDNHVGMLLHRIAYQGSSGASAHSHTANSDPRHE